MIVRLQLDLSKLLFTMHGSIVPRIMPALLVLAGFTLVVALLQRYQWVVMPNFSLAPFTILGLALSLFLGFRNQAACERIANTPLPFAFTLLTHRTALIYCYTLPFVLVAA